MRDPTLRNHSRKLRYNVLDIQGAGTRAIKQNKTQHNKLKQPYDY